MNHMQQLVVDRLRANGAQLPDKILDNVTAQVVEAVIVRLTEVLIGASHLGIDVEPFFALGMTTDDEARPAALVRLMARQRSMLSWTGDVKAAEEMVERTPIWRHYKGGVYEIVTLGYIEASMERAVVYRNVASRKVFVRPLSEFLCDVVVDNVVRPRFEPSV